MKTIFVSDTHIKFNESPEDLLRRKRFTEFLSSLKGNTSLLILNGDIFDLWVSWKHVIIREYFELLVILKDLHQTGTRIVLTPGNHDFWFSDFLSREIGIEICENSFIETIEGKKFFVNHGDSYTKNDLRYQIFRCLVRNNTVKKLFTSLHPDLALDLGILLSRSSRKRKVPQHIRKKMISSLEYKALDMLANEDYDVVVFSHIHQPVIIENENGIYVNTGDWVSHSSYLQYEQGKFALYEYSK